MRESSIEVLGLFPASGLNAFGGVQASGREAWSGVVGRVGSQRAHAFSYRAGTSRAKALLVAIANRRKAGVALVWHLDMLKILPVLDRSAARVVLFLHGIEAWRRHDPLTHFLLKKVDLILSNSDYTWARFIRYNPSCESTSHRTVHLGIATSLAADTPCPSETPSVLMLGRLDPREDYKGHRQMIEAWPGVLERMPAAELWIAGEGDLRPSLEKLAERSAPRHSIRFDGEVSNIEKDKLIRQCRCLAMPSRGEGFGLVYLEAMRMGRPCIVSDDDAGREVVNPPEGGLSVDPDNPDEIANAVVRMLTPDRDWANWSRRARERYESQFTSTHFQQRLLTALFEN